MGGASRRGKARRRKDGNGYKIKQGSGRSENLAAMLDKEKTVNMLETFLKRQLTEGMENYAGGPARTDYAFKGIALVGNLRIGHAKGLVSPTGFEPVVLP